MTVSSASEALAALASLRDRRMSPRERAEVIESVAAWIVAREAHVRESLEVAVRLVRDSTRCRTVSSEFLYSTSSISTSTSASVSGLGDLAFRASASTTFRNIPIAAAILSSMWS